MLLKFSNTSAVLSRLSFLAFSSASEILVFASAICFALVTLVCSYCSVN